jgi:hypothetical protein
MIRSRRFDCRDPHFTLSLRASLLSKAGRRNGIASASGSLASPKSSRHVFSPRRNQLSPGESSFAELGAYLRHETTIACPGFKEVGPAQRFLCNPIKQPRLNVGADRFEDVECERVTVGSIRMQTQPQARVESYTRNG